MATRGQKPKSGAVKVATGNPGKRPLKTEPETKGPLGGPPPDWPEEAEAIWWEIVEAVPGGVLTQSDRVLVELAARNLGQIRASSGNMTAAQSAEMRRCLGELGMTPSERQRLAGDEAPKDNPFAGL